MMHVKQNHKNEKTDFIECSAEEAEISVDVQVCYNDQLQCPRCRMFSYDVGKLKQWPDLCLRCADSIEAMVEDGVAPNGVKKDWSEWLSLHENTHVNNPLRKMKPTLTLKRGSGIFPDWELVYMPEETFKEMYKERLGNPRR